ncbi:hypothetical protein MW887_000799 [Aspergillus wentii]|nr:hypothetical protein MW887_000799 [Aspergillus wentii]
MSAPAATRRLILGVMNCLDLFHKRGYCKIDTARAYDAGRQEAFTREATGKSAIYPLPPSGTLWALAPRAEMLKEKLEESLHRRLPLRGLSRRWPEHSTPSLFPPVTDTASTWSFSTHSLEGSSGKYKSTDEPTDGRFSKQSSFQGKTYRYRYFKPSVSRALEVPEPVVEKYGLSLVEVALRWCVHHSGLKVVNGNDGAVIGFSGLGQLQGNLADLEKGPLPAEVVDALDQAWLITKADSSTFWHGELKYTYDTEDALLGRKVRNS